VATIILEAMYPLLPLHLRAAPATTHLFMHVRRQPAGGARECRAPTVYLTSLLLSPAMRMSCIGPSTRRVGFLAATAPGRLRGGLVTVSPCNQLIGRRAGKKGGPGWGGARNLPI
jgi:hypothetical protein